MGRWAVVCVSSMRTQGEGEGFFRERASGERAPVLTGWRVQLRATRRAGPLRSRRRVASWPCSGRLARGTWPSLTARGPHEVRGSARAGRTPWEPRGAGPTLTGYRYVHVQRARPQMPSDRERLLARDLAVGPRGWIGDVSDCQWGSKGRTGDVSMGPRRAPLGYALIACVPGGRPSAFNPTQSLVRCCHGPGSILHRPRGNHRSSHSHLPAQLDIGAGGQDVDQPLLLLDRTLAQPATLCRPLRPARSACVHRISRGECLPSGKYPSSLPADNHGHDPGISRPGPLARSSHPNVQLASPTHCRLLFRLHIRPDTRLHGLAGR